MSDPEGIRTVTLHGLYVQPDLSGTPLSGTITFTPSPAVVTFPDQKTIVSGSQTATLDSSGAFSITLIATDMPNEAPSNWTYTVSERLIGLKPRTYQIALPYTTALMELAQITPTDQQPTWLPVIGPPGVIQTINGHSAATVNLTAADVSAVATSALGAASGVATLDGTSHLTAAQLPTNVITQGSGDARYVQISTLGAASGTATLDASSHLTVSQLNLATSAPPSVGTGAVGTSNSPARADHTHDGVDLLNAQSIAGAKNFTTSAQTAQFGVGVAPGTQRAHIKSTVNEITLFVEQTASGPTNPIMLLQSTGASDSAFGSSVAGDTNNRFTFNTSGGFNWGPGNAGFDAFLYREAANTLSTTDTLIRAYRAAGGSGAFAARIAGDTQSRWYVNADGTMNWGSGSAGGDLSMVRSAAGILSLSGTLAVSQSARVSSNVTVGGSSTLGDNGVGEVQLTDAATPPTTNPTGGSLLYSQGGIPKVRTASGLITDLSTLARNDLGIYVPPGWGQFWKPKRNAAGSAQAVIAAVGSSSTQGLYSSNLLTAPWVSKLMTNLQGTYGDGGSGYFHTARSLTFMGAGTVTNAWNAISGNFCTVTNPGNWGVGNPYGPGANYIYTQTVGDTVTFIIRGTKARIYTIGGGGRSNWSYTVDGGSSTSVTDIGGSTQVQVTSITGLSAGSHTIVMTKAGSAGTSMAVCGVTGENNTGIVVNNFGISGGRSGDFTGFTNAYDPGRWTGGPDYPADLVIYALGANDVNNGYTADSWAANLDQFLNGVRDGATVGSINATGNTDVLIVMQHIGKYDPYFKWQDYCARARTISEAYGAALVNVWPQGRNSWNYWNSLNYWGNASTAGGVAGTDTIHMSDAGHTAIYNAIQPILTAA